MIKNVLHGLFNFLKRPDDKRIQLNLRDKSFFLFILFIFNCIINILFIPISDKIEEVAQSEFKRERDYHYVEIFILAIIVMPFIEELLFRYFLRYGRINPKLINIERWNIFFPYMVYFSSATFALLHLLNFSFSDYTWWLIFPVIVFPQFIGALIITYVRVRLNFYSGVLYHIIWNLFFMMLIPLLYDLLTS